MRRKGTILIMVAVCFLGTLLLQKSSWALEEEITFMTRNLYLGADITPAMTAQGEEELFAAVSEILGEIAVSDFPERAEALADEIADKMPHLVGLQEVVNFTFNGSNGAPPFRDYLEDLLNALKARGVDYEVAGVVRNLALELPFGGNTIGVVDRDVILARSDVHTEVVDFGNLCRASEDGCNYQVIATFPNPLSTDSMPLPPIGIERGFVAVEAEWPPGNWITFVNTHLEERETGPLGLLQAAQAHELITFLSGMNGPVVVVGDFNSDPRDPILDGPIVPPYQQLTEAGYFDAWTQHRPGNPNGLTCCQDEDLFNLVPAFYERVDLIFSSEAPRKAKVDLVGDKIPDKTSPSGLWPSDHAGVSAQLGFKP